MKNVLLSLPTETVEELKAYAYYLGITGGSVRTLLELYLCGRSITQEGWEIDAETRVQIGAILNGEKFERS